ALSPLAVVLVRRFGVLAAAFPLVVVAAADAVRFGLGGPSWAGWVNVIAGWLVPYLLGIAWARGAFPGRWGPVLMLAGGTVATAALVLWAGYPASMVGVNGAAISNLNPPTLAAVTFGIAQAGLALLLAGPLARWMRRPLAWAAVATVNLSAMTLFLWHQTAFLAVTAAGLALGTLPGLHTAPVSAAWVPEPAAWFPVSATVLGALWLVFRRAERAPRRRSPRGGSGAVVPGVLAGERGRPRLFRGLARRRGRGLSREEQHGQDGPGRGDQAGHEAGDGQAMQERVRGRAVDHLDGGGLPGDGGGRAGLEGAFRQLARAQLDRHRVLDERDEGGLGGRPAPGVAFHDRHAGADRQRLLDVGDRVRELPVEPVDAHDERQPRGLEVIHRGEG